MTYHPNDLLQAVDALTLEVREPVTRVINGTTRTERVTHPPLLVQLEEAIHGSMRSGSGASSNLPGTAIPLDGDALYRSILITATIREWCRIAGVERRKSAVQGLREWHAFTLASHADYSWHTMQLRQWAGLIRSALNPRRRRDLPDACPECKADTWRDDEGNSGLRPLVVSWQPDANDVLATAAVTCRACGLEWRGITAVRAVAWKLEHPEMSVGEVE